MVHTFAFMKAFDVDQGGGGVKNVLLEIIIAVMLLLVKCYDNKMD